MSVAPGAAANARIAAKQAELQALQNLRVESARLAQEISQLGEHVDDLVSGGITVSSVMGSWQGVFRAIQIAQGVYFMSNQATTAASRDAESAETNAKAGDEARPTPDALVRIPIQSSEGSAATTLKQSD
ncbi:DASH complex subunit dad2 [Malassezia yamatoensis]|uniref:DASH complex subunit DAD2 n=1 Tax=Malassezia yamatoensis TaxID=253288 RepID=A0AAJ5Z2A8_9BASI|nr:DASH complex subunit dad2 [Malassezia yamatoensis]